MTNDEKLALDPATAVGTKVLVNDCVVVIGPAGEPDALGIYVPIGFNQTGLPGADVTQIYQNFATGWTIQVGGFRTDPTGGGANTIQWAIFRHGSLGLKPAPLDASDLGAPAYWGDQGSVTETPDEVSWSTSGDVDRPPFADPPVPTVVMGEDAASNGGSAVQQLVAPSTDKGGMFVIGTDNPEVDDAIYPNGAETFNGKQFYTALGGGDDPTDGAQVSIIWVTDLNSYMGSGPSSAGWVLNLAAAQYYSLSAVATPDLAASWKRQSDGTGIAITVTALTIGELSAGCDVAGGGTAASNGTVTGGTVVGPDGANQFEWQLGRGANINGVVGATKYGQWEIGDPAAGRYTSDTNVAFPWQIPDLAPDDGDSPAPTITRNDVATESNWSAV